MRLVSFGEARRWQPGFLIGRDHVVDAARAATLAGLDGHHGERSLLHRILGATREESGALRDAAEALGAQDGAGVCHVSELTLGPPVPEPDKVLCVGLNYRDHADEVDLEEPVVPTLFPKFRNGLIGPGAPIVLPAISSQIDFEGELALVIGRRCKNVPVTEALDCVAGFMPFNDVSARDVQMQTSQWTAGKAVDGFAPCGPTLMLAEDVPDPSRLEIRTRLNGETMQSANTADMIFGPADLVAYISSVMTLERGDIIVTGTPAGVGFTRKPPVFLGDGDVVEVEIEGLGLLRNPVVAGEGDVRSAQREGADVAG